MGDPTREREPSVARAVAQFALSGLVAVAVLAVVGILVLRHLGRSEAIRDARARTQLAASAVVRPLLTSALLAGDERALARLDDVVRRRLLGAGVVRVKLWTHDGRIVYSDEHRLIGARYPLGADDLQALRTGRIEAGLSDLSAPENRFERRDRQLLEVYLPVRAATGERLLYEQYLRFSSITASGRHIWLTFLPALLAGLLVLELVQLPLGWSLARRLRARHREREALLARAIESSNLERRRIAADLHDGVVQDLAGISFGLAAAGEQAPAVDGVRETLHEAARATRQAMRGLRSLLVEIYPPNLQNTGLAAALSDLVAPAAVRGLSTSVHVEEELALAPEIEALLFRVAQEAVRNVLRHADAGRVSVEVSAIDSTVVLLVEDDGRGFAPADDGSTAGGHFGLSILRDLAGQADGRLEIDSAPGGGTRVRLEVPAA